MDIRIETDVEKLIKSLEKPTIAKVLRTIDLLERFGHRLGMPHSKKMDDDFFELRVRGQQEIRIFYTFSNRRAILFYSFIKKTPKTPKNELRNAFKKLKNLT
jgi:phage-related protein